MGTKGTEETKGAEAAGKESLRQRFITLIEQRILSGEYKIGRQLPPERKLSEKTGISRTIVHAGIVELAAQKVLTIVPRKGTYVNDFQKEATPEIYNALMRFTGKMDEALLQSLTEYREINEVAAAWLAAQKAAPQQMEALHALLAQEQAAETAEERAELDYRFHLQIALAAQNVILPMTMRALEPMYKSQIKLFYQSGVNHTQVHNFHRRLIEAIGNRDGEQARQIVKAMLDHGKTALAVFYAQLPSVNPNN